MNNPASLRYKGYGLRFVPAARGWIIQGLNRAGLIHPSLLDAVQTIDLQERLREAGMPVTFRSVCRERFMLAQRYGLN